MNGLPGLFVGFDSPSASNPARCCRNSSSSWSLLPRCCVCDARSTDGAPALGAASIRVAVGAGAGNAVMVASDDAGVGC